MALSGPLVQAQDEIRDAGASGRSQPEESAPGVGSAGGAEASTILQ